MINVIAAVSAVLAAGEGEEMPSVLAVPIDELIIGIIAFLIVFGGAGEARPARHPARRSTSGPTPSRAASSARPRREAEAKALLEQYQAQLAEAREEAAAIRAQAQADARRSSRRPATRRPTAAAA